MTITEDEEYAAIAKHDTEPSFAKPIPTPDPIADIVGGIDEEIDWSVAAPKLRDKLYRLAKMSDDPKVVLPVFTAIAKMFPDVSKQESTYDINLIMSILTKKQLKQLEEMSK